MTDIELLPLPEWCHGCGESLPRDMQTYARAVAEHNVKALQAELDNRWARGVHTCHDNCQRTACVLRRDNDRLAEALREARAMVEDWAGYASEYFQDKHDLQGDLAKLDAALAAQQGDSHD